MTDLLQKALSLPAQTPRQLSACSDRLDNLTSSHGPEGAKTQMRPVIYFRYSANTQHIDQRAHQGELVGHARLVKGVEYAASPMRPRRFKRVK